MQNQKTRYLYGAAVQGIQAFIFGTNELRDIVGASELVDSICKECFREFGEKGNVIVNAAGNVKCIFQDEKDCANAVKLFPQKVICTAPGVTISQAVVKMTPDQNYGDAAEILEARLRAQRNKPLPSVTTGLMGIERSPKTGLPAVTLDNGEPIDMGTWQKRKNSRNSTLMSKFFGYDIAPENIPWNMDDITRQNQWIAIIHADGNSLGEVVSRLGKDEKLMASFSQNLDKATTKAAQSAYQDVVRDKNFEPGKRAIPFRPIVLGGDDLTLVCRADLALDFTKKFIAHFEENTRDIMRDLQDKTALPSLTACAGIAFIKASYPFYYGYQLAESLCERAKRDAKRNGVTPAPSCLMFHKVQSSFVEDFEEITRKELSPQDGHSYMFGPYYIKEQMDRWTVDQLQDKAKAFNGKEGNATKSSIRQWLTEMADNPLRADKKKDRVTSITSGPRKALFLMATEGTKRDGMTVYPAYDMLSIHSISMAINH